MVQFQASRKQEIFIIYR